MMLGVKIQIKNKGVKIIEIIKRKFKNHNELTLNNQGEIVKF